MLGRSGTGFALGLWLLALVGCRDRGSADQDSRPLPTPEPPVSASPARVEPTSAPKKPAADDATKPKPPSPVPVVTVPPTPTAQPTTPTTGGAPATGGAAAGGAPVAVPTTVPTVPPIAAPSAACLSRCQGAMQGCLAQPVDGGVPGFANLDLCKKAFEACQAACKQ